MRSSDKRLLRLIYLSRRRAEAKPNNPLLTASFACLASSQKPLRRAQLLPSFRLSFFFAQSFSSFEFYFAVGFYRQEGGLETGSKGRSYLKDVDELYFNFIKGFHFKIEAI